MMREVKTAGWECELVGCITTVMWGANNWQEILYAVRFNEDRRNKWYDACFFSLFFSS